MGNPEAIAITGATGFVGSHVVPKLNEAGYKVRALVRSADAKTGADEQIVGDLASGEGLGELLSGAGTLIHLAARIAPPDEELFSNNVTGTRNLVEGALKSEISHFVLMSTAAVYGESKGKAFNENSECHPGAGYGLTKYLSETLVDYWATKTGKTATILRPFNIYGPGDNKGVVYKFYESYKQKGKFTIYGTGEQIRDFLYVEELAEALGVVLDKKVGGIFNLGSGEETSLLELTKIYNKVLGQEVPIDFQPQEAGKPQKVEHDVTKAKEVLGWKAKLTLEEGLRKSVKWFEAHEK